MTETFYMPKVRAYDFRLAVVAFGAVPIVCGVWGGEEVASPNGARLRVGAGAFRSAAAAEAYAKRLMEGED